MSYTEEYITNDEYDEALRLYHNGLDYTKAFTPKKEKRSWFIKEIADSFMEEGEEYRRITSLPDKRTDHFIISNFGRVVNTKTGTQQKVWITKNNILVHLGGGSVTMKSLFEETPYEYDWETITNRYIEKRWKLKKQTLKQFTQFTK